MRRLILAAYNPCSKRCQWWLSALQQLTEGIHSMDAGAIVTSIIMLVAVAFIVWFSIGLLKVLFRVITTPTNSESSASYPSGADEPDGSSYSEVHGDERLD
jgi:hypothetical protein